jgi:predicted homoserine dehydrogenase-like protein
MPATASLRRGALPIGLAHRVPLVRDVARGEVLSFADVDLAQPEGLFAAAVAARRAMEARYAGLTAGALAAE